MMFATCLAAVAVVMCSRSPIALLLAPPVNAAGYLKLPGRQSACARLRSPPVIIGPGPGVLIKVERTRLPDGYAQRERDRRFAAEFRTGRPQRADLVFTEVSRGVHDPAEPSRLSLRQTGFPAQRGGCRR